MKVAIPLFNGRVAPALDWAGRIVLAEVREAAVTGQVEMQLEGDAAAARAAFLVGVGVDVLICGGVSAPLAAMLDARGVHVLSGVSGEVTEVLGAFLRGQLEGPRWAMPGWGRCGRGRRRGRRRERGRGRDFEGGEG